MRKYSKPEIRKCEFSINAVLKPDSIPVVDGEEEVNGPSALTKRKGMWDTIE